MIAIIVTLSVAMLPVIGSTLLLSARKTAVDQMMSVCENARIAALSSGANSYIGFATSDTDIPNDAQFREFIVFRDSTEDDPAGGQPYIQLTKWQQLPKGVSFVSTSGITAQPTAVYAGLSSPDGVHNGTAPKICVLQFTPTGGILPNGVTDLSVYLYEGFYLNHADVPTPKKQPYVERLSFSHYTGRIQADVVAPSTL